MKKFILAAIAALSFASFASAEVLTGNFNTGRDEESDNSSSLTFGSTLVTITQT